VRHARSHRGSLCHVSSSLIEDGSLKLYLQTRQWTKSGRPSPSVSARMNQPTLHRRISHMVTIPEEFQNLLAKSPSSQSWPLLWVLTSQALPSFCLLWKGRKSGDLAVPQVEPRWSSGLLRSRESRGEATLLETDPRNSCFSSPPSHCEVEFKN
jgi:hypothetical protein